MADFVFNIAKGRVIELYNNVKTSVAFANSAFVILALNTAQADETLESYDTLSDLLTASGGTVNVEANNVTGYERKVLTDADLATFPSPDDTNDWFQVSLPDQTWTAVSADGTPNAWVKLLICYDGDTTGGTDANIIPMTAHDFAVTPDGSDIVMQVGANGFFRAA